MRPLFTVHAGEYLVGEFIEKNFSNLNVWIPSKDTDIDLLVTNITNTKSVSLQVKLSRDYRSYHTNDPFESTLTVGGWFALNHSKIEKSTADYWVFILVAHDKKIKPRHIVISPKELLKKLIQVHTKSPKYNFYLWIRDADHLALDGRGLSRQDKSLLMDGKFALGSRNYSTFIEKWDPLKKLCSLKNK
jgi:hypothetical protein